MDENTCLRMVLSVILQSPMTSIPAITDPDETKMTMISFSYNSAICRTNLFKMGRTIRLSLLVITFVPTLITTLCLYMLFFFTKFYGPVKCSVCRFFNEVLNIVVIHRIECCTGSAAFRCYFIHPGIG